MKFIQPTVGGGGGGAVNSVTATAPIYSSGGANPDISTALPNKEIAYGTGTNVGSSPDFTWGSGTFISNIHETYLRDENGFSLMYLVPSVGFGLGDLYGQYQGNYLLLDDTGADTITFSKLAGTGTEMVVSDPNGVLSRQAIPTGSMEIGLLVINGAFPSVLFINAANQLDQDPTNFYYNPTNEFNAQITNSFTNYLSQINLSTIAAKLTFEDIFNGNESFALFDTSKFRLERFKFAWGQIGVIQTQDDLNGKPEIAIAVNDALGANTYNVSTVIDSNGYNTLYDDVTGNLLVQHQLSSVGVADGFTDYSTTFRSEMMLTSAEGILRYTNLATTNSSTLSLQDLYVLLENLGQTVIGYPATSNTIAIDATTGAEALFIGIQSTNYAGTFGIDSSATAGFHVDNLTGVSGSFFANQAGVSGVNLTDTFTNSEVLLDISNATLQHFDGTVFYGINANSGVVTIGDLQGLGNSSLVTIDDTSQEITAYIYGLTTNTGLELREQLVTLGMISGGSGTKIEMDDTVSYMGLNASGSIYLGTTTGLITFQGGVEYNWTTAGGAVDLGHISKAYDYYVDVDVSINPSTVTLPDATTTTGHRTFVITDAKGNAAVNNITVAAFAGQTIQGAATYTMNTNYQSITVHWNGSYGDWIIT